MVENVVIDWSRQIQNVLKKNSAQPLLEGKNPGPMVEIEFWNARCADLESVVDQLSVKKVTKMSQLLEKSLSSYYPAYKSMMEAIYNALDDARDIRYPSCAPGTIMYAYCQLMFQRQIYVTSSEVACERFIIIL